MTGREGKKERNPWGCEKFLKKVEPQGAEDRGLRSPEKPCTSESLRSCQPVRDGWRGPFAVSNLETQSPEIHSGIIPSLSESRMV
ncbi:hypothetical protein C0J45_5248 [Silurus meridionalis]|nr:hypothetical protein C0J45_5248 [Silurus meridionalis]